MFYNGSNISIDIAYCLCHKHKRPSGKQRIFNNVQRIGLNTDCLKFFTAGFFADSEVQYVDNPSIIPSHNCAECHRVMMQECIDNQYTNVLFLEDDVILTDDFVSILDKLTIPSEYHELSFGGYCRDPNITFAQEEDYPPEVASNPQFIRVGYTWGLFGTIVHHSVFQCMMGAAKGTLMDTALRTTHPNPLFYILNYPTIVERDERSAINGLPQPRLLYHQCIREGRINE